MSLNISLYFGIENNFPTNAFDVFMSACLEIKGLDTITFSRPFDLFRKGRYVDIDVCGGIFTGKEQVLRDGFFSDEIVIQFDLWQTRFDDEAADGRKWTFYIDDAGGGDIFFWGAFYMVPVIALKYLPALRILEEKSGIHDNLESYLKYAGHNLFDQWGKKDVVNAGLVSKEGIFLFENMLKH